MVANGPPVAQRPPRVAGPELLDTRADRRCVRRHATDENAEQGATERNARQSPPPYRDCFARRLQRSGHVSLGVSRRRVARGVPRGPAGRVDRWPGQQELREGKRSLAKSYWGANS